jgi:hypothetical protein
VSRDVDIFAPMHTLSEIEDAIRASWSLDTAEEDDGWTPDNPSRGHCDVTSLVVHDIFGGDVLAADVLRYVERVEAHMWNRLPGGMEVDLTREQFRNGEVIGEPSVRQRPARFPPEHPRYHRASGRGTPVGHLTVQVSASGGSGDGHAPEA